MESITLPTGTKISLVAGIADIASGFDGLARKGADGAEESPDIRPCLHLAAAAVRSKLVWSAGDGLCLLTKRLSNAAASPGPLPAMAKCS